jgi:hypothetical protein
MQPRVVDGVVLDLVVLLGPALTGVVGRIVGAPERIEPVL